MTFDSAEVWQDLKDMRCSICGKLFAKIDKGHHVIEIKCARCGAINSFFQKMTDQVMITDPNGVILYVNPTLEEETQYSSEELIGKRPSVWGNQMPKEFYKKIWQKIKKQKIPVFVKLKNKRKDGTTYNATLRITPVLDAAGEILLFVGTETIIE